MLSTCAERGRVQQCSCVQHENMVIRTFHGLQDDSGQVSKYRRTLSISRFFSISTFCSVHASCREEKHKKSANDSLQTQFLAHTSLQKNTIMSPARAYSDVYTHIALTKPTRGQFPGIICRHKNAFA